MYPDGFIYKFSFLFKSIKKERAELNSPFLLCLSDLDIVDFREGNIFLFQNVIG